MEAVLPVWLGVLFGPLMLLRLNYIDGQFDKLLLIFQKSLETTDKKFQSELAKTPPEKEMVLSCATQIGAQSTICNNIKKYSSSNRRHIIFDLAAIVAALLVSLMGAPHDPEDEIFIDVLWLVLGMSALLSVASFVDKFGQFNRLKNKAMSIQD